MNMQEFCSAGWWFCRVKGRWGFGGHRPELHRWAGKEQERAGEIREKGLHLCAATHHAWQFLSDNKKPWLLFPAYLAGNGFSLFSSHFGKHSCPQLFHTWSSGHQDPVYLTRAWSGVAFAGECKIASILKFLFHIITVFPIRKFSQYPGLAGSVGILGLTRLRRQSEDKQGVNKKALLWAGTCILLHTTNIIFFTSFRKG